MVKLIGPMMSIAASGKFADTMVFARKGGTAYARQRVIPFNPKSAAQTGNRALFSFLASEWAGISPTDKASWQALADSMSGQPFNAYMHENQLNWKQFLAPGMLYPIPRSGLLGTSPVMNVTGQVGQTLVTGSISVANTNWGVMIFRSTTTAFTTAPNNCIAMVQLGFVANSFSYIDSPLAPDTYFYNYRLFGIGGPIGAEIGEDSAVVT